jgi:trehalose 6-phosphate phosphatase
MSHLLAAPVDLHEVAILLDVDGTLLDLAATPREVYVPPALRETLGLLLHKTDGALALVSGRPLADLDMIFAPLQLPAVGGHGAEIRATPKGRADRGRAKPMSEKVRRRFATVAAASQGILVEDKGYSIALHYRLAPEMEAYVHKAVAAISEELPESFELLPGKAVIEIKLAGFDKGTAVRSLMRRKPFAGRRPVFVGDDTTDEAAFAVLPELDGVGISVGRRVPGVATCFDAPADVRMWLQQISQVEEAPAE